MPPCAKLFEPPYNVVRDSLKFELCATTATVQRSSNFQERPRKTAFAVRHTEEYSLQYPKRFSARGGAIPLGGTDVG